MVAALTGSPAAFSARSGATAARNQHLLTTARPDRAAAVIGGYMACYSLGSALGAITTTWAYGTRGWAACCGLGAAYALCALVVWAVTRPVTRPGAVVPAPARTEASCAVGPGQ